jgi:hypothetical protein
MAWRVGTWTIKPGVTHRLRLSWSSTYVGVQYSQPLPSGALVGTYPTWFSPSAELFAFDHSVRRNPLPAGGCDYLVSVRNGGPTEIWYSLEEGGVT